jgi:polyhydroxybutyrate depolymerase
MRFSIFTAFALLLFGCTTAGADTLEHAGKQRDYVIARAPNAKNSAPALFVLHGGGIGTAQRVADATVANGIADGYVYVFPNAINSNWNDGRTDASGELLYREDDAGFLLALAEDLARRGIIDRKRIYFSGISNGGMMAIRMACDHPEIVAGIGVVAASMQTPFACAGARPTPAIFMHGTADRFVPLGGSAIASNVSDGKDRGRVRSIPESLAFWAKANQCGAAASPRGVPDRNRDDQTSAVLTVYGSCTAPLAYIAIKGGGHTWPGQDQGRIAQRILGNSTLDFDGTLTMLAFFEDGKVEPVAVPNVKKRPSRRKIRRERRSN